MAATVPALCPVDSKEFRNLPYKLKLEAIALKLFDPPEYRRRTGAKLEVSASQALGYPVSDLSDYGLSAEVVPKHWAAYQATFNPNRYPRDRKGLTVLDYHDIGHRKVVNVHAFNFPLLSLDRVAASIFRWIVANIPQGEDGPDFLTFIDMCSCLVYIDCVLFSRTPEDQSKPHTDKFKVIVLRDVDEKTMKRESLAIYDEAIKYATNHKISTIDDVNGLSPMIGDSPWFHEWRTGDLALIPIPRFRNHRWFYPLVPKAMFNGSFSIADWGWL